MIIIGSALTPVIAVVGGVGFVGYLGFRYLQRITGARN